MRSFVLRHIVVIGCALALVGFAGYLLISSLTKDPLSELTTTTTESGKVEQIVSVSGVTKSANTAC
jgi:multidrug efflux pump subunit AcrA (membrane-fusion protein)